MANEIQIQAQINATKNSCTVNRSASGFISMTNSEFVLGTQSVTTAWSAISLGAITAPAGALWIRNTDSTNGLKLAVANDDSGVFAQVPATLANLITPISGVTYYAQAVTGTVRFEKAAASS